MEVQEISSRVDYALQKAKGGLIIDEYQKSLYLTRAQALFVEQVLANYEYGDVIRHILGNMLVTVVVPSTGITSSGVDLYDIVPNTDVKSVVYESVNGEAIKTIPLDYNDIHDAKVNPFRKPYKNLTYRITGNKKFTIFSSENVSEYKYIYCKEPEAIILEDLPAELSIQGVITPQTSALPYDSVLKVIDIAVAEIIQDVARLSPQSKEAKQDINN